MLIYRYFYWTKFILKICTNFLLKVHHPNGDENYGRAEINRHVDSAWCVLWRLSARTVSSVLAKWPVNYSCQTRQTSDTRSGKSINLGMEMNWFFSFWFSKWFHVVGREKRVWFFLGTIQLKCIIKVCRVLLWDVLDCEYNWDIMKLPSRLEH